MLIHFDIDTKRFSRGHPHSDNMLAKIVIDKRKDKGLRQALVVADGGPYPDNIRNADNKCYKFRYDDELDVDFVCLDADQFMEIIGQPEKKRFPIIQK